VGKKNPLTSEKLMHMFHQDYCVDSQFEAVNCAIEHAKKKLAEEGESESNLAIDVLEDLEHVKCPTSCESCGLC